MKNKNLNKARKAKNDEFYTQLSDIEKELSHYGSNFTGRTVYMNCDNPEWSNFWKYFHQHFSELGLKKIISSYIVDEGNGFMMEYTGGNDNDVSAGQKTPLNGNGDFRSDECIEILKEADIVVTNPPFSLFREYVKLLMYYGKKFLILGNHNASKTNDIFPFFMKNLLWYGVSLHSGGVDFQLPNGLSSYSKNVYIEAGNHFVNLSGVRWFTNIDCGLKRNELDLSAAFNPKDHKKYDNYDAINVDSISKIPYGYSGKMGVPITILDKDYRNEFELIDVKSNLMINGKNKYARIIIQRKEETLTNKE